MESWESEWADYYAELRCSPDDPIEVIRGIYRAIVKRYHPDKAQGDAEKMVRINAAFAVLGDPDRRRAYDGAYAARKGASDGRGGTPGPQTREPSEPQEAPGPGTERPEPDIARGGSPDHNGPTSAVQRSPGHEALWTGIHVRLQTDAEQSSGDAPVRPSRREPPSRFDPDHPFPVFVDYRKSVRQMVEECKFDLEYQYSDVLKKYKHGRSGSDQVTIFLYRSQGADSYDSLMLEISDFGYRAANICELLAFGSAYPVEQYRNHIFGWGTRLNLWDYGYTDVVLPMLSGKGYSGRGLQLNPVNGRRRGFSDDARFAVVAL